MDPGFRVPAVELTWDQNVISRDVRDLQVSLDGAGTLGGWDGARANPPEPPPVALASDGGHCGLARVPQLGASGDNSDSYHVARNTPLTRSRSVSRLKGGHIPRQHAADL